MLASVLWCPEDVTHIIKPVQPNQAWTIDGTTCQALLSTGGGARWTGVDSQTIKIRQGQSLTEEYEDLPVCFHGNQTPVNGDRQTAPSASGGRSMAAMTVGVDNGGRKERAPPLWGDVFTQRTVEGFDPAGVTLATKAALPDDPHAGSSTCIFDLPKHTGAAVELHNHLAASYKATAMVNMLNMGKGVCYHAGTWMADNYEDRKRDI
ncbi:hypothetical protein Bbelb_042630 [Branchiostoma belcheri]|nr:hypothetical protein Bbelb_042630 [Branchiostoma belcheri]